MRITKLFTHTDLDGVSCAIIMPKDTEVEYCEYHNINNKVEEFIDKSNVKDYGLVLITDLSLNEKVAEKINNSEWKNIVRLLDHHPTALWMNKYDWCTVEIEDEELKEKTCGTYMLYKYLNIQRNRYKYYVNLVRLYDTYLFKEKGDDTPKMINDLFHLYKKDNYFIDKVRNFLNGIENVNLIQKEDYFILKIKQNEIDEYIEKKNKQMIEVDWLGYKAGFVVAEMYHSELGNRLSSMNPHLDFVVITGLDKGISYRTVKEEIDLGQIAKLLKGGGHPKASGSPIREGLIEEIVEMLKK